MKPKISIQTIAIILISLLLISISVQAQNPWIEDIEYFASQLPKRHKNLFFKMSKEEFEKKIEQLKQKIPNLKDYEIVVELQKIIAEIGDSHTMINPFRINIFHKIPIGSSWFSDGLYIISTTEEYKEILGKRILSINKIPINEVYQKIKFIIPHENEAEVINRSPQLIVIPEILAALQILENPDSAIIEIESIGEKTILPTEYSKQLKLISILDGFDSPLPLYLQNRNKKYWCKYLPGKNMIYVQYNSCSQMKELPFSEFQDELLKNIDSLQVNKLIFDMRFNGGGNSSIADPLIKEIKKREAINKKGHLFVVIGRKTFSSAILNSLHFKNTTEAIFIGEATGGKPNHYGEVRFFMLPKSKIIVTYSTKYFTYAKDDTPSFLPDIKVDRSFSDLQSGRDPVFEAILNYKE